MNDNYTACGDEQRAPTATTARAESVLPFLAVQIDATMRADNQIIHGDELQGRAA